MGLEDDLDKKSTKELKEMILNQETRLKNLEKQFKEKGTSIYNNKEVQDTAGVINAFDFDLVNKIGTTFNTAVKGFMDAVNVFDMTVFEELDKQATGGITILNPSL